MTPASPPTICLLLKGIPLLVNNPVIQQAPNLIELYHLLHTFSNVRTTLSPHQRIIQDWLNCQNMHTGVRSVWTQLRTNLFYNSFLSNLFDIPHVMGGGVWLHYERSFSMTVKPFYTLWSIRASPDHSACSIQRKCMMQINIVLLGGVKALPEKWLVLGLDYGTFLCLHFISRTLTTSQSLNIIESICIS